MNLALGCDVRMAARRAKFDTRFLQIGIHPGGGHTWMFRRIAGPQAAMATVVFGEVLDGAEAERVGLAYRCVDDDDLLAVAHEMAARAASAPRELVEVTKQTIQDMADVADHPGAVARELEPQLWSTRQPWFAERIAALQAQDLEAMSTLTGTAPASIEIAHRIVWATAATTRSRRGRRGAASCMRSGSSPAIALPEAGSSRRPRSIQARPTWPRPRGSSVTCWDVDPGHGHRPAVTWSWEDPLEQRRGWVGTASPTVPNGQATNPSIIPFWR